MRKASLYTLFITVFLDLLGFGLVVPYLPGVARSLGASDFVATLLGASYALGQLLFVPIWGALSDRVGRRPVLLVSVATTIVAMLVLGSATELYLLFVGRVLGGIATANIAVAQAYIADVTSSERRGEGMGLIGVAIGLGFVLGPAVGGVLASIDPWSRQGALPAYVAAALGLLNLVFVLVALPESLPPERRLARGARASRSSRLATAREAIARRPILVALIVNLVVTMSFGGLEQTFRLFSEDGFGMTAAETGYALLLAGLVLIGVQGLLLGPVSRRLPERSIVMLGLVIEAVGFSLVAASPPSRVWLHLGLAVLCFGSSLVAPSLSAFASKSASLDEQGKVLGVFASSGALARVLGPMAAGALYQWLSPRAPYAAAALGMMVALLVAIGLVPPKKADAS